MSRLSKEKLEDMREPGHSTGLREDFAAAARAVAAWEQSRPSPTLDDVLDRADELRSVFGAPIVDRRPWMGSDFRL